MKSLREYIAEEEATAHVPRAGDNFSIEFDDKCIIESYVIAVVDDAIVIAGDNKATSLMESQGCQVETIRRYGAVGSNRAMGYTMGEDQDAEVLAQKELAIDVTNPMPGVHEGTAGLDTVEFDIPTFIRMLEYAREDARTDMDLHDAAEKAIALSQDGKTLTMDDYDVIVGGDDNEDELPNLDEAEYQGRNVPLGKPMRGDVKKFKVYVRDPSSGNIKKVNFGHGGTSAKRAGQKTMKIKKSNPARRKSFRARHNCDNPGPRTKARYWSCRAW